MDNQPKTFKDVFLSSNVTRDRERDNIIRLARNVIPVLRDHNMPALATEFERSFFVLDGIDEEISKAIKDDPAGFTKLLLESLSNRER